MFRGDLGAEVALSRLRLDFQQDETGFVYHDFEIDRMAQPVRCRIVYRF